MEKMKSFMMMPWMMGMMTILIFGIYKILKTGESSWFFVILTSMPVLLKNMKVMVLKNEAHQDRFQKVIIFIAAFGVLTLYFDIFRQSGTHFFPIILATTAFFGIFIFNFWLTKVPAETDKNAVNNKLFPSVQLMDHSGKIISTNNITTKPALFMFIRGNWCPFCMAQVKEIAGLYKEISDRGIQIVIVSPQKVENTVELAERFNVPITYLIDDSFTLANALNLVHKNGVPKGIAGYGKDTMLPTIILTDEYGKIIHTAVTDNSRVRPEPSTFLELFDRYKVNHELEEKVSERTAAVRDLLDNAEEGFLTFGSEYSVHKEYSAICREFFNQEIKYKDILNLLFKDDITTIRETISIVFQGLTQLDVVKELLPKETIINKRVFSLRYRWIKGKTIEKNKILLIIKEITFEKELEKKISAEESFKEMVVRVAVDREGFLLMIRESNNLFSEVEKIIKNDSIAENINDLFRSVHTLKSSFASYSLSAPTQTAHILEKKLLPLRTLSKKDKIDSNFKSEVISEIEKLKKSFESTLLSLTDIVPTNEQKNSEQSYKITENRLLLLEQKLSKELSKDTIEKIIIIINSLRYQPIGNVLSRFANTAYDISEKLGKKIDVFISGGEIELEHKPYEKLFMSLVHLIRNSVDHGVEFPDERAAQNKNEKGIIKIEAEYNHDYLKLLFSDDGSGIDIDKVSEIAINKGLLSRNDLLSMDEKSKQALIFAPGFSTKKESTELSGRGVGMDAVKNIVDAMDGSIDIISSIGKGSTFILKIPSQIYR